MKNSWIYKGNFRVTSDMVSNGMLIKEMIPNEVTGYFDCSANQLTSLEGSPKYIGLSFWCNSNNLTSLEYGPKNFSNTIFVDNGLETEKAFIESGQYINEYWVDLLKYMIHKSIDLTEVKGWPKNFLTDNMIISTKGLSKFKL